MGAENDNQYDQHAVAVLKAGDVIGHVPRSLSTVTWLFLRRGGSITCRITGKRKLGVGLEVPCVYTYSGSAKVIEKLIKHFNYKTHAL